MSSIEMCHSAKPHSNFDFEGLEESLVDNNEDDDDEDFIETGITDSTIGPDPNGSGVIFDHNLFLIRDALIRDSANRTDDDIEIIVRFLSIINSNHDHMTRKRLAPHFVLAEIEARDTRVLTHGEKLDAYCIVAAGSLRHVLPCEDEIMIQDTIGSSVDDCDVQAVPTDNPCLPSQPNSACNSSYHHHQNIRYLHVGDEFGAHLDDRIVYGEIFTNEDFVWVLCVPHVIFDQICGEKTFKTIRDEVTGNIIEMRANCLLPIPASNESNLPSPTSSNEISSPVVQQQNNSAFISQPHFNKQEYSTSNVPQSSVATSETPNNNPIPPRSLPLPPSKTSNQSSNDSNELIRATKARLYELVLNSEPNETFIEDFLLTFRIWSEKELNASKDSTIMADLMDRICNSIRSSIYVENCVRIVLIWMVNHFQDFQNENRYLLDEFENVLKENFSYKSQLRLFYMNLSAKSVERQVTVTRSDRNSPLPFSVIGGYECSARLFIGEILSQQTQSPIDLRPGDRIILINGVDCHVMPIGRAYELCRSSTHLSLQVKYDPHLFYALIEGRHETKRQIVETFPLTNRLSTSASSGFGSSSTLIPANNLILNLKDGKKENSSLWKQKVRSLVSMTTNQIMTSTSNILHNSSHNSTSSSSNNGSNNQPLNNSSSNSSITSLSGGSSSSNSYNNSTSTIFKTSATHPRILSYEVPEIIKIYLFENNDFRFLPIHSSTTARECIQLALREFQLQSNYSSRDFALYEYSVIFNNTNSVSGVPDENNMASSTVVKRLSDGISDLVNNLGLNSRFYLKMVTQPKESIHNSHHLSDADISKEILKDSSINSLLTLNGNAIARELTARDFRLFCKIEAQQFVYDLAYNDPNHASSNNATIVFERTRELQEFERKTNEEMFWTINQVLGEKRSLTKRVKAIKQLIRIATLAMKLNNYNTLFAILSGLMHLSVSRLKSCWDRVPTKHLKQLQKLQQLMDPSRNFYNFRQQLMQKLRQENGASIIIPFFPLVKKDLSFIWLANQTYVNSAEPQTPSSANDTKPTIAKTEMLVNWEKMRLLSEKIREIQKMANTTSLALAAVNGTLNNGNSNPGNITSPSVPNEPIDPNLLFRIFADATTSEDPRTFSHKRLWENQRMTKRVQSFLDETFGSITSDEHVLMTRSYSCELPQTPNSSHATTRSSIASTMSSNSQLSHPSPTPSSASSSSNSLSMHSDGTPGQLLHRPHRPRFGQTSPNQLRKLLALSDGSVVVPHNTNNSNNSSNSNSSSNNNNNASNNNSNSNTGNSNSNNNSSANNNSHGHHHHHNHSQFAQHNTRSSNSSLNSNLSGSNSYYNNVYGSNQHQHSSFSSANNNSVNGYVAKSNLANSSSSNYLSSSSHQKVSYSSHGINSQSSQHQFNSSGNFCPMPQSQLSPCCCSSQSAGPLFPNQSYCGCCNSSGGNSLMRPPMMMMPPPQTSGLMHPACPCAPNQQSVRRQSSYPAKQSLPVESSSVTSLRRLEQYQQMTRYRDHQIRQSCQPPSKQSSSSRRPQCPDYDTAMLRLCGGNSLSVNGTLSGPNNSSASTKSSIPPPPSSHYRSSSQAHPREDIV